MKMDRQIAVLRAIGRHSGPRKDPVDADALSRAVTDIAPTTVILSNKFFEAAGWIASPAKGNYAATDALVEYTRRLATGTPEYSAEVRRDPARQSWFWEVLEPQFADGQRLAVNDAVIQLMRAAEASDGLLPNIRNLIAWLEHVGMVTVRDQGIVAKNMELVGTATPAQSSDTFGPDLDYAMVVKEFRSQPKPENTKYSPSPCKSVTIKKVSGAPDPAHISTSYFERQNLTIRMSMRRFTRLTNAFSRKLENLTAAVSLHFMFYNFARPHQTLTKRAGGVKTTPAVAAGVADHVWSLTEIAILLDSNHHSN